MSLIQEAPHAVEATERAPDLTVVDAVWIGVALLQRRCGSDHSFTTEEIVDFVTSLHLTRGTEKSVWQHVQQHSVANRKKQPNRACMLFETSQGYRRLFREGDRRHPEREGGRTHPEWDNLPAQYADLRGWYERKWNHAPIHPAADPLLELAGAGTGMWDGLDADAYIAALRSGWEGRP